MLFSLFATLTRGGLNPRMWLAWNFESCAAHKGHAPADITPSLPGNRTPERRQILALDPDYSS